MTPEEGTKKANELKALFVNAFDPTQCLDNMDDLVGEFEDGNINRCEEMMNITEDYFRLEAVQDALKKLDRAWLHTILDELAEAHPKFR
tara:strand:+ start:348 stop:614 length:267 start_codon:yes stop_codon:yes gene_type:complete